MQRVWIARAVALCAVSGLATAAMAVSPVHTYDLNNSLADSLGGPSLTQSGGTLGATGYTFSVNGNGLFLDQSAFSDGSNYTIALNFRFDRNDGYDRILYTVGSGDNGLYTHLGRVNYYQSGPYDGALFSAGDMHELVFSRGASFTNVYLDGSLALGPLTSFTSSQLVSGLNFFIDDGAETSPGFVDRIRIYDGALTAAEVGTISETSAAPEPASWAMMVGGFGLIGGAMRRRQRTSLAFG